ncbi:MAG: GNAT family N-acetyltransferase, partial [Aeriscardovia aeriphila]|nr:GNAT family N-acetyltransferase [Aeriscardovia aeriphila]
RVIRRATYADIPRIQQLEAEAFGPISWDSQFLDKELSKPDQDRIVLTVNGEIAGFAASWTRQHGESMVLDVCVFKAFQGQHVAQALMVWLLDDAVAKGQKQMVLQVKVKNDAAQNLYRKFGFIVGKILEHYYLPYEDVDAFEMRRSLDSWQQEREHFAVNVQLASDCTPGQGNPIREAQADTRHAEVSDADAGNDTAGNAGQNADEKGEEN